MVLDEFKQTGEELKKEVDDVKKKFLSLGRVRMIILGILVVCTVLTFVFYNRIFGDNSVFTVSDSNSKIVNDLCIIMPRIIRSVQIVTITAIVITVLLWIIKHAPSKTPRSITVIGLICSLIRWLTAIVLVIVVLAVWGVDTTAIIASAGVLTLVVGLGMQSLIADVVAGLFIIFENEFNVGDIITVDGFRGTVVSIGIRTTKLEQLGNIKILNNSDIHGVLNQTMLPSTVFSYVSISYGADLSKVETIIKEHLSEIKIEGTVGDVLYDGVTELGASGVTVRFSTQCHESLIYDVQRMLNAKIKIMFDRNGIEIPFNQIVVHAAKDTPEQSVDCAKDEQSAIVADSMAEQCASAPSGESSEE